MNIAISDIDPPVQVHELNRVVAGALNKPEFQEFPDPRAFVISMLPSKGDDRCRTGKLYIPVDDIGRCFIREYGGPKPRQVLRVRGRTLKFDFVSLAASSSPPASPKDQERARFEQELRVRSIPVGSVEFGWECRDGNFSLEHEIICEQQLGSLYFDPQRRQFRLQLDTSVIALRAAQITWAGVGVDSRTGHTILFFSLAYSPIFETFSRRPAVEGTLPPSSPSPSSGRRLSFLDPIHAAIAQYVGSSLRVICPPQGRRRSLATPVPSSTGPRTISDNFRWLCNLAHINLRDHLHYRIPRNIFCQKVRDAYAKWLSECDWPVAFQVDRLARDNIFDLEELLRFRPHLNRLRRNHDVSYAASFIRFVGDQAATFPWWKKAETEKGSFDFVMKLWVSCKNLFVLPSADKPEEMFNCFHATVTPTALFLDGPFLEWKNRVIRKYEPYINHFLRVSLQDEDGREIHWDRDTVSASAHKEFCHARYGSILSKGLTIAGRHFEYLAYSQSGLKQHTVWFVTPFQVEETDASGGIVRKLVTRETIIADLGVFRGVEHDPELMFCPARLGARIAQSFTPTQTAFIVDADEVAVASIPDIEDQSGRQCFTDGVGTISEELAAVIWKAFKERTSRGRRSKALPPRAFQIRYKGCKGMLSVDYKLTGLSMCTRPSMTKFDAPNSTSLEVVATFNKPGPFYLNRPLITLLEALDVEGGYDIFKELLDAVIQDTKDAMQSAKSAGYVLERYGLGAAFKLPSIFATLAKLGFDSLHGKFFSDILNSAVYHVLRDLRHRARILVPDGYTLVGVADVHGYLEEGQIFACIDNNDGAGPKYIEGPVLIARSPTSHPGDVRVVQAIGRPPAGTPFAIEPLTNTVVMATRGSRSLASCLAGGDYDGDVFVLTTNKRLLPRTMFPPAEYNPARRKTVPHESTTEDIIQFITKFLYSDIIGRIAKAWLLRAELDSKAALSADCLKLAALHSDATDYPKTGMEVKIEDVPRNKSSRKPDWDSPEVAMNSRTVYYPSERYIGRLFREVHLGEVPSPDASAPASHHHDRDFPPAKELLSSFETFTPYDAVDGKIYELVAQSLDVTAVSLDRVKECRDTFMVYRGRLQQICFTRSLFQRHGAMLSEVEVVVGTIVGPSSQPRMRKDKIAEVREQAALLVNEMCAWIVGNVEDTDAMLERAWMAWRMSYVQPDAFGSQSFRLIALYNIVDGVQIEQHEAADAN